MVEACVRCLRAINSDFSSPVNLPEAMSAKYRMCSSLANACQVTQVTILMVGHLNVLFCHRHLVIKQKLGIKLFFILTSRIGGSY